MSTAAKRAALARVVSDLEALAAEVETDLVRINQDHTFEERPTDEYTLPLDSQIDELKMMLVGVLDDQGLHRMLDELMNRWADADSEVKFIPEFDTYYSPRFDVLRHAIRAVKSLAGSGESPVFAYERQLLERILESSGALVERRQVRPKNEHEFEVIVNDYLKAVFPTAVFKFSIPGIVKNFKPDAGVVSIGAAIEYKYAASEQEARNRVSELFEDSVGYKGDSLWRRFYSVIYMTGNYLTRPQLLATFQHIAVIDWTPILVVEGSGDPNNQSGSRNARCIPTSKTALKDG